MTGRGASQEIELKVTLDDPGDAEKIVAYLASLGYTVAPGQLVHNEDLYLDTFEWTLLRKGLALRLRSVDGKRFYTLKSVGKMADGLADRFELEVPVRRTVKDPTLVPVKKIRNHVASLIHPRSLVEQVLVRTERRTYDLTDGRGTRIELAFDSVGFQARGFNRKRTAPRLNEMEAELIEGDREELARISGFVTERFKCRPSEGSKLEAAMERLKVHVPSKKPPKKLMVRRDDRFDLAVQKILAFQLQRFDEYLPGVHLDIDTEFVHQARVATRRMRSALKLFRGALPQKTAEHFRRELGWIAGVFGEVRDLDVFLLNLPTFFETIESSTPRQQRSLARWVEEHRAEPLDSLGTALRSDRLEKLRSRIQMYIKKPLPKRPSAPLALRPVGETAPVIILELYQGVIKQGRKVMCKPKLKNFHKLRIQTKKLRYACEFMAPAYGKSLQPFIKRTTAIQDCLGELQDTVFTRAFIERILADWKGKAVDPGLLFSLGEIYQFQGEIARKKQAAFVDIWRDFDRKAVNDELRSILNGERAARRRVVTPDFSPQEKPSC